MSEVVKVGAVNVGVVNVAQSQKKHPVILYVIHRNKLGKRSHRRKHGISNIIFYPVICEVENCIMFFYQFPATCPTIQKIELYMERKFYIFQLIFVLTYFKCMLVAIS